MRELEFTVEGEPILTNNMYKAYKSKARGWAVLGKSNDLIKYQRKMRNEVLPQVLPESVIRDFIDEFNKGLYDIEVISIHYVPSNDFYKFDVSNLIKAYEDCIARHLGIDDVYTSEYTVKKVRSNESIWKIHTIMKLVEKEI